MLFFGEYGVIGLETVFGEHCFIARPRRSDFCEHWDGMLELTLGLGYLKGSCVLAFDLLDRIRGTYLAKDSRGRAEDILVWMP